MGLQDRDYMRERRRWSLRGALVRWWRETPITELLITGILAMTLLSSVLYFARRELSLSFGSREATLCVNINTAKAEEIETLPGIGRALAQLIIAGQPYDSVDDLERIEGIGSAKMESLRPFVKTSGKTERLKDGSCP